MANDVAAIAAELAVVKTDFEAFRDGQASANKALSDQIAALQAQLAAGQNVSQADLDGLMASAQAIDAEIKAAAPAP